MDPLCHGLIGKLFLARAQRKGFAGIPKGTTIAPLMSMVIDEKTPAGKEEKKNCNSNNYAYKEMLLSIQTKTDEGQVAFHIATGSISTDLPDRDTALAWTRLNKDKQVRTKIDPKETGTIQGIPG